MDKLLEDQTKGRVSAFNASWRVGDRVLVTDDYGEVHEAVMISDAFVANSGHALVSLEPHGQYLLSRVTPKFPDYEAIIHRAEDPILSNEKSKMRKLDKIFDFIFDSDDMTIEDLDEELKILGYDPDELANRARAFAEKMTI